MVDIQTVTIAIACVSVVAGVVYYAVQIRHQSKTRQMSLLMNLYLTWGSDDMRKAVQDSLGLEDKYGDYDDFVKKYGVASQAWVDVNKILWFMNGVGFLVRARLRCQFLSCAGDISTRSAQAVIFSTVVNP